MLFSTIMFLAVVVIGVTCLIIWKKKIDPHGHTVWIYLAWVLLCVAIAAALYQPWIFFT